jgi:hypothetical protein
MKKSLLLLVCCIIAGGLGLGFIIYNISSEKKTLDNALIIDYKNSLAINVQAISFERNGLYLNDKKFSAGGISWYSRVHDKNSTFTLNKIAPPFLLRKLDDNDTLNFIKGNDRYYLLVSEEVEYANRK